MVYFYMHKLHRVANDYSCTKHVICIIFRLDSSIFLIQLRIHIPSARVLHHACCKRRFLSETHFTKMLWSYCWNLRKLSLLKFLFQRFPQVPNLAVMAFEILWLDRVIIVQVKFHQIGRDNVSVNVFSWFWIMGSWHLFLHNMTQMAVLHTSSLTWLSTIGSILQVCSALSLLGRCWIADKGIWYHKPQFMGTVRFLLFRSELGHPTSDDLWGTSLL